MFRVILNYVKLIVAIGTVGFGAYSLIAPKAIKGFTGLVADGSRGISEIRAVMGGVFIALGLVAIVFKYAFYRNDAAYLTLGLVYLTIAVIRLFSILFDKAYQSSNFISLASEIVFGVLLIL
jgi:hypothetical protein